MLNLSKIFQDVHEVTDIVNASCAAGQAVANATGKAAKIETIATFAASAIQAVAASKGVEVDAGSVPGEVLSLLKFCGSLFNFPKPAPPPVAVPFVAPPVPGPGLDQSVAP